MVEEEERGKGQKEIKMKVKVGKNGNKIFVHKEENKGRRERRK